MRNRILRLGCTRKAAIPFPSNCWTARTGQLVVPSNYLVRVDHHDVVHNEWVKINDDGSALVTLPADAADLSVQATYDTGMEIYTNCDGAKEKAKDTLHWYAIADIVKSGNGSAQRMRQDARKGQAGRIRILCEEARLTDLPARNQP